MKSGDIMKHRGELFALAELWVVLFHLNLYCPCHLYVPNFIAKHGNIGVDIFLFLSGLGLSFSLEKNSVKQFYLHRIKRVLLPSVCVAFAEALALCAVRGSFSARYVVLYGTLLSYWVDGDIGMWYISFILLLYALFPLIKEMDRRTKHIGTLAVLAACVLVSVLDVFRFTPFVQTYEKAISRVPVFLCGVLAYPAVKKDKARRPALLLGSLLALAALLWAGNRHLAGLSRFCMGAEGIFAVYLYTFIRDKVKLDCFGKWLNPIGAASLELYVVHVTLLEIWTGVEALSHLPWFVSWICVFCLSMTIALAMHVLFERLWRRKTV